MKNIYTWAAVPAKRTLTVGDLKAAKGKKKFTQVTANTTEEASAAEKAGFDMIISNAFNVKKAREGSKNLFLTAALVLNKFVTAEDIMRGAFKALENGADAVMTPRSMDVVEMLAKEDVPVMGHLGLTPQSKNVMGGYKIQGKTLELATKLLEDAVLLDELGCFAIVLEKIPAKLAKELTQSVKIPIIWIGAGSEVDGQVLVMHDMLGMNNEFNPRFLRRYADLSAIINKSVKNYVNDVKSNKFPNKEEEYK